MKKILFSIISLVCLASCSVKTNEEKARDLIEPAIKANLIKPDSYELANMKLDSCFNGDANHNAEAAVFGYKLAQLYTKYKESKREAERAESAMTIYAPSRGFYSAHDEQQYKKFKADWEIAQRKVNATKEQILNLYKDYKKLFEDVADGKHEFVGWMAMVSYRAETVGGKQTMGNAVYYLNKDMTEIINSFSDEDVANIETSGIEDIQYEFGEELKKVLAD